MEKAGWGTDRGRRRNRNEDAVLCLPEERFYMVADGVGGHNAGNTASEMAAELIREQIQSRSPAAVKDDEELKTYFLELLESVNDQIAENAHQSRVTVGMATTAVMLHLAGDKAYVINVGDSRVYLQRDGMLHQITEDHTLVNELLKKGMITKEEAEVHPEKNMITRALGGKGRLHPDFYQFETADEDWILLCTDGLYNELTDEEISKILEEATDVDLVASALVDRANAKGGRDNITVVGVKIYG